MAKVTNMPDNSYRPIWIWDVNDAVGPGKWNRRGDVMLVQCALNRVIRPMGLRDDRKRFYPGPENPLLGRKYGYPLLDFLVEDGRFGKETAYAIKQYQKVSVIVMDGAVDPVHPLTVNNPDDLNHLKITTRMMYSLNEKILRTSGKMMDDSEFPPELRADIRAHGG